MSRVTIINNSLIATLLNVNLVKYPQQNFELSWTHNFKYELFVWLLGSKL